ncbi:MAG: tRNA 2-thiocytidine(32) synthetase TtcA [Legionellales bacterium]|nr:tRNA 2-thiocytidine(32) synthetase TtcA [Legionellales bacterium]
MEAMQRKEKYSHDKIKKRLRRNVGRAIADFNMIEAGDRIMVCLSGGADSYTMLDILQNLQRNAPVKFELIAINLDQKQPGFPKHVLPNYLDAIGISYHIIEEDTYSIVKRVIPENKTYCSLCSRLRRGIIYRFAKEHGYTKIALGHHREDIIETLFLNMFYGGRLKSMPAKLLSDDGENIIIRPLAYCAEIDIKAYAIKKAFPIIPCTLCGSQDNMQRQAIKEMLTEWNKKKPGRVESIFTSIQNTVPSHLLDTNVFDFEQLGTINNQYIPELEDWLFGEEG